MRVGFIAFPKARVLVTLGIASFVILPMNTQAASTPQTGGITVAPAEVMLDMAKGSPDQDAAISVKNNASVTVHLSAAIEDLGQANDGSLVPAGDPNTAIATALTITPQDFLLQSGQSVNIKLHLSGNNALPPGGSYAAILIRQVPDKSAGQVEIVQAVSVTVFMTKEEGATRILTVNGLTSDVGVTHLPRYVTLNFQNKGNTNMVPRAAVTVFDPSGKAVATGVANQNSVMVLPNRQLRLRTYLKSLATTWRPGRYTIQVTYRYDGSDGQQVAMMSHWVFPPLFLSMSAGVLCLVALTVRALWWFWPSIRLRIKGKPKVTIALPKKTTPKTMDIIVRRRS